ncbi:MAG TPA: sulfatase-like hydrolase/transferase [Flavisolibacter sp.]|nr:sulfatase-like hydrolase/transferase [Flavisolibacter sp.]
MQLIQQIKRFPLFLFLLPLFFVFHGYTQNLESITAGDVLQLLGEYGLATGLLLLVFTLVFRNQNKAALFTFALMFLHFFFGAFHDTLKKINPNFFLAKYSVLLPLLLAFFILLFILLKHSRASFQRIFLYLNTMLLLLLLLDSPALFKKEGKQISAELPACTTCDKPDVFLIIADEYADSISLAQAFGYNNGAFQTQLRNRGFHLVNKSRGSYNFTPYAVASLLGMNYLPAIKGVKTEPSDLDICYSRINENPLLNFFERSGYEIKNFSIFNVANQPTKAKQHYILIGKDRLVSQTLLQRLRKDLAYHLVTTLKLRSVANYFAFYTKRCNENLLDLFNEEVQRTSDKPRFVYTHLLMPHFPYYYDKAGRLRDASFVKDENNYNKQAYVEYLQYGNSIFLKMIDDIIAHSAKPPIILFMGDHGFRWFDVNMKPGNPFYYMNLNAVYLPGGNYSQFYNGLSGVNQFRVLLNTSFGQHIPLLKDTSYFINE